MRAHLWLAGLTMLASISTTSAAQDVEVVANSILRAYSDYCHPLFFEQNRAADAPVDPTLAQSYARVLFTRDLGQCDRFFNAEVVPAAIVPGLLGRLPELQRPQLRTLSEGQLALLGGILRYDDITQNECGGQPQDTSDISSTRAVAEPWWSAVGRDDVLELAKGYVEAEAYAQATVGFPSAGGTVTPCSAREVVGMMISFAVTGLVMPQASGNSTPPANADVQGMEDAMNPYLATWGTTFGCSPEGPLLTIGRFTHWGTSLGYYNGGPRLISDNLSCELAATDRGTASVSFDADCVVDGAPHRRSGSIREVAPGEIDLVWTGGEEPVRLFQCGWAWIEEQVPIDIGLGN